MFTDSGAAGSNAHPNIFFLEIYQQEILNTSLKVKYNLDP